MITESVTLGKVAVSELVDYILDNVGPMSHLKLQKLLFYVQAYHLAYFEKPLMDVDFEAWVHGPVCREVFDQLKNQSKIYSDVKFTPNGDGVSPNVILRQKLLSTQIEIISETLNHFKEWSGLELEQLVHNEQPWIVARSGLSDFEPSEAVISNEEMVRFYKRYLS